MLLFLLGCPVTGDTGEVPDKGNPHPRDSGAGDDTDSGDTDTDTGDPGPDDCDVVIESTMPEQGAVTAYYRAPIEFVFSEPVEDVSVEAPFAGAISWSEDGETLSFTPEEPLEPDTWYVVTLNYCRGEVDLEFATSELGKPLSDSEEVEGRTYALDLASGRVTHPAGVGDLLRQYLDVSPLLGVVAAGGADLQLTAAGSVAESSPPEQELCDTTIDLPSADFADSPYFEVGAGSSATLSVAGIQLTVDDFTLAGSFAPDGTYVGGMVLQGTIDTRPLDGLVSEDAEEGYICELAAGLGVACEACEGDGGEFCVGIAIDHVVAEEVRGLVLVEVDGEDCMGCVDGNAEDLTETCAVDPDAPASSGCIVVATSASLAWAGILAVSARRRRR